VINLPLTKTGKKIKRKMVKRYGKKKGLRIFYATENKHRRKWTK